MKHIYLDNAAGTPLAPEVVQTVFRYTKKVFVNPSALYTPAKKVYKLLEKARSDVAKILNARPEEIIFTSCGTESNNIAIIGTAFGASSRGKHIITSEIEHPSVLRVCQKLEKEGFSVTYLPCDSTGMIVPANLRKALRLDTVFVSLMYANNEVGTIQPVSEYSLILRKHRKKYATPTPYFHTDASQATGYLEMNVKKLGVDLLTLNGSKIYGPRGTALLYIRRGVPTSEVFLGGGQELGIRPGTQNVPAILGFVKALKLVSRSKIQNTRFISQLRDYTLRLLSHNLPNAVINGSHEHFLPHILHITLPGYDAEVVALYLDSKGVSVGLGAACSTGSREPSHVLLAMGKNEQECFQSLRVSMNQYTTKADMKRFVQVLRDIVKKLE